MKNKAVPLSCARPAQALIMLIVPVFLCLIAVNPPQHGYGAKTRSVAAIKASTHQSHSISGQGAPRESLARCLGDIASFETALKRADITPVAKTECVVDESEEHYAPKFFGAAEQAYSLKLVTGSAFSSRSHCELQRLTLVQESTDKSFAVDSACIKQASEMFAPVVLVRVSQSLQAAAE